MEKVTLIKRTDPFCGACLIQESQLAGAGIEFTTIDITRQPEAVEEYDLTGVPVLLVEVDGEQQRFDGFVPAEKVQAILEGGR